MNMNNSKNKKVLTVIAVVIMVVGLLVYIWNSSEVVDIVQLDTINGFEPKQFNEETFLIFYATEDEKLLVEQVNKKGKCLQKYAIDEPCYVNADQNYYNSDIVIMSADNDSYVNSNLMYYDTKTSQFASEDIKVITANNIGEDILVSVNLDNDDPSYTFKDLQYIYNMNDNTYSNIKLDEPSRLMQMAKFGEYIVIVNYDDMIFVKDGEIVFNLKEKKAQLYNEDSSLLEVINVTEDKLTFIQSGYKQNVYSIDKNFNIEEVMIDERNSEMVRLHTQHGLLINDYTFLYTSYLPKMEDNDEFICQFNVINLNDKTIKTVEKEYIKEKLEYMPLYVDYYKGYLYLSETNSENEEENLLVIDTSTHELVTKIKLERDRNTSYGRMVVAVEGE